jgi:hypothetical protein
MFNSCKGKEVGKEINKYAFGDLTSHLDYITFAYSIWNLITYLNIVCLNMIWNLLHLFNLVYT